ncbi:MAG TPA: IPT/TIG domain-containing protein [Dongiaceae bacterium]|nr:IPT/TIG domain-containing protein [Dongiaceae bacterium]
MRSCRDVSCKLYRVFLLLALTHLSSAWTCSGLFFSCQTSSADPQITTVSPSSILMAADSTVLTVQGSGFVSGSQVLWNGNALKTTFVDSRHLQATVTQQTFESFGGSVGGTADISVNSPGSSTISGCSNGGSSTIFILSIG